MLLPMKVLLLGLLASLASLVTAPALAQCSSSDTVYIDPRLVPQRPHITAQQLARVLAAGDYLPEYVKRHTFEAARTQNDPIKMPMQNGYVLISPTNPCIQQFVPVQ